MFMVYFISRQVTVSTWVPKPPKKDPPEFQQLVLFDLAHNPICKEWRMVNVAHGSRPGSR